MMLDTPTASDSVLSARARVRSGFRDRAASSRPSASATVPLGLLELLELLGLHALLEPLLLLVGPAARKSWGR
jgi:hypothetical protein